MTFPQFARDQFIRVIETNETADMGAYTLGTSTELDQISLWINVEGNPGGSETMQIEIYGSSEAGAALYTSDVVTLSDVVFNEGESTEFSGTGDFIGVMPFGFSRENLASGQTYYLKLKMANYTRNGDTYYIGYVFDNPEPVYSRTIVDETAAKALILGFES